MMDIGEVSPIVVAFKLIFVGGKIIVIDNIVE